MDDEENLSGEYDLEGDGEQVLEQSDSDDDSDCECSICIQSELSSMSSMFSLRLFSSQYQLRRYSISLCRSRHGLGIVSPKNVIKKMITFI